MNDLLIIMAIIAAFLICLIVALLAMHIEDTATYRNKKYLEHEIVRYYSLCTSNLTKSLIYKNLEESETFRKVEKGESSNPSALTCLLLIAEELKKNAEYPSEIDAITEEVLRAISLTERMLLEKGLKSNHKRNNVEINYIWNYWKL